MLSFFKPLRWIALILGASVLLCAAAHEKAKLPEVKKAILELKAVHPQNSQLAKAVQKKEQQAPAGYRLYDLPIKDDNGKTIGTEPILLAIKNIVTGDHIQRAVTVPGRLGTISILLDQEGGEILSAATKKMRTGVDRLAIVLNGKAIKAPTVNGHLNREFIIEGLNGTAEVKKIVSALNKISK